MHFHKWGVYKYYSNEIGVARYRTCSVCFKMKIKIMIYPWVLNK